VLTPAQLKQRTDDRFPDNDFLFITPKSFRDQGDDMLATFVPLAEANVPAYDPTRFYAEEYLVTFDGLYYRAKVQGFLPAPTPGQETAEWLPDLKPLPATVPYRELTVLQAQDWASDGLLVPSTLYRLQGRVTATGDPLADVLVVAVSRHHLSEADAYTVSLDAQTRQEQVLPVSYSLATDTTGARAAGGGGTSYSDEQARAAPLDRVAPAGTTTVTLTAESPEDYGTAASGTFTVDGTGCVVGKEAYFDISAGGTAPLFTKAPSGQPFDMTLAKFVSGVLNRYAVRVFPNRIEVIRTK
jgi:hypothetical protein